MIVVVPFGLIGLVVIGYQWWIVAQWAACLSWEEVPCQIVEATIVNDDDSIEVFATYTYNFNNRPFKSETVSLYGTSGNIGSFTQQIGEQLVDYRESQEPFRCFVSAKHPTEAILYRNLRWELHCLYAALGVVFGVVGLCGFVGVTIGRTRQLEIAKLAARMPDEPWRWRPDWVNGEVASEIQPRKITGWTCLILAASAPLFIVVPIELAQLNLLALAGAIPSITVTVFAIRHALRVTGRRKRYGDCVLRLTDNSGIVGGRICGAVVIQSTESAPLEFVAKLECKKVEKVHGEAELNTIFSAEHHVLSQPSIEDDTAWIVPVSFSIPYRADLDSTQPNDDESGREWEIDLVSKSTKLGFREKYVVPVFLLKK
jgi:hypothetical protein